MIKHLFLKLLLIFVFVIRSLCDLALSSRSYTHSLNHSHRTKDTGTFHEFVELVNVIVSIKSNEGSL